MSIIRSVMRTRPFLWLLGLALVALVVSVTWERGTSYDDGGIGTVSFVILYSIGVPFLLPSLLLGSPSSVIPWIGYISIPLGLVTGCAFYLWLDRMAQRRVRNVASANVPPG
jgi:hypothetical protein